MTPQELDELEEQLKDNINNSDYPEHAQKEFEKCLNAIDYLRNKIDLLTNKLVDYQMYEAYR